VRAAIDAALIDPDLGDLADRDSSKTAQMFNIMNAWKRA
jgi:hypothetical protein